MIKVAVDAMGGDLAPKEQVLGAMLAIKRISDIEITLFGKKEEIEKYLKDSTRIDIVDARDVIQMGEKDPVYAIRHLTDSSLVKAFKAVATKTHDALCTSGPTQALVVGSHLLVHRMEGFKRPCLAPVIPTVNGGRTVILDCGANLEVRPDQLVQQARFAIVYAKEILGKENPSIGLMNIGTEEGKGREFEKECFEALKNSGLNFYGNVETKDILDPPCDCLISDGFTTNMVVKTMEGTAKGMGKMLKNELKKGFFGKIGALLSLRNLNRFKRKINPDEIAAAMIFGLKAPVIKAHGSSDAYAFSFGIELAYNAAKNRVIEKVSNELNKVGGESLKDE